VNARSAVALGVGAALIGGVAAYVATSRSHGAAEAVHAGAPSIPVEAGQISLKDVPDVSRRSARSRRSKQSPFSRG
jgi:hypothetical protein